MSRKESDGWDAVVSTPTERVKTSTCGVSKQKLSLACFFKPPQGSPSTNMPVEPSATVNKKSVSSKWVKCSLQEGMEINRQMKFTGKRKLKICNTSGLSLCYTFFLTEVIFRSKPQPKADFS
jgi:hypothetical protein